MAYSSIRDRPFVGQIDVDSTSDAVTNVARAECWKPEQERPASRRAEGAPPCSVKVTPYVASTHMSTQIRLVLFK